VIDLDRIDVTNLNRQFLFRRKDVGRSKAEVAAAFVNERCPWMKVTPHFGKIQDKPSSFYASFACVITGLDNINARRWLNSKLCGLVKLEEDGEPDPSTIIPLIDGGTEGFRGQARVILPRITSCYECSLDSLPKDTNTYPLCTVAETPRLPEHCIAYAMLLEWPKVFPDKKIDVDSPVDMKWVFDTALERANRFGIQGVTYMLTMGVVKNIIPAVASTNAIISAACVNETVKLLTFCSQTLNNYFMYMGSQSVYCHTFVYEKKDNCPVCTSQLKKITLCPKTTLHQLLRSLQDGELRLVRPSAATATKTLYMPNPPALELATRPNLDVELSLLIKEGEVITITDEVFDTDTSGSLGLSVFFQ